MSLSVSTPEISKPLNINRGSLINRLQENLDKERRHREEVEAKEAEARRSFQQFFTDHEDEFIVFLGRQYCGSWKDVQEHFEKLFEDGSFKPKGKSPSEKENDLEKFVRVLKMATDETIEVTPQQPIYHLL